MKREIKFRGLRTDGKWWAVGYIQPTTTIGIFEILHLNDNHDWTRYKVIPLTVGQFTGLKDKNGVDIYEGDIVVSFKKAYEDKPSTNMVKFVRGCFILICIGKNDIPLFNYMPENLEIIGNIHEK